MHEYRTTEQLKRFRRACLLFTIPLLLAIMPAFAVLTLSRESWTGVEDIIQRSNTERFLVGFAYNERNYGHMKYRRLMTMPRQDVVAIGSSRVLGFREEMFTGRFYNAGFTIVSAWDFRTFLDQLPDDRLPRIALLGLDQFMFNADNNRQRPPKAATAWTVAPSDDLQTALTLVPDVWKDLLRGRIAPAAVLSCITGASSSEGVTPVGLNGLQNGKGFRNDGSFVYGSQVRRLLNDDPRARDAGFRQTLGRVRRGSVRFNWGDSLDHSAIEEIDSLLSYCRRRGIHVVAFLPPYTDTVWQEMHQSGHFAYLGQVEMALQQVFRRYDSELYAFQSMQDCAATDREAIDGFHCGEVVYLKMLIQMLAQGSAIEAYTSIRRLRRDVEAVVNRYIAYAEPLQVRPQMAADSPSAGIR